MTPIFSIAFSSGRNSRRSVSSTIKASIFQMPEMNGGCPMTYESDIGIPTSGIRVTKIISAIQFLRNQRRKQMMDLPVAERRKFYPSGTHEKVIEYGL